MKKTNIFKTITVLAAITIFVSCKKEIAQPKSEVNVTNNSMPAAQAADVSAITKTKIPQWIPPDSTKTIHP